jgi:uncharacterized membrane protein
MTKDHEHETQNKNQTSSQYFSGISLIQLMAILAVVGVVVSFVASQLIQRS